MRRDADWATAGVPTGAHAIAEAHLQPEAYAHTRGVAQQAARLARNTHLDREDRARLLCAAWLHQVGGDDLLGRRATARTARRMGHERIAVILAHHRFAAMEGTLRGMAPLEHEFALPTGRDEDLVLLLDVAVFTTDPAGAPCTPATVVRAMMARATPADPAVRAAVALLAQLADHPDGRPLVELVAPRPAV